MFTHLKFKTSEFNKCAFTSFISFIFSIFQLNTYGVFDDAFPGICGVYS